MAVRIGRPGSQSSFYEMFSDLIFGMMAVFVLLFIVLISLLRPPPSEAQAPTNIDLVIAIDVSGSMGVQIEDLKTALGELGSNFPNLIDDFRIGLIAYRDQFTSGEEHSIAFPLEAMTTDNLGRLLTFLDNNVVASGGYVDPVQAISKGLELFTPNFNSPDRTRIFVLIGDVRPEYTALTSISNETIINANAASSEFVAASNTNRVLSIYSGDESDGKNHNFFCQFAVAANDRGRFVTGSELLIWKLMAELWKGANTPAADVSTSTLSC